MLALQSHDEGGARGASRPAQVPLSPLPAGEDAVFASAGKDLAVVADHDTAFSSHHLGACGLSAGHSTVVAAGIRHDRDSVVAGAAAC